MIRRDHPEYEHHLRYSAARALMAMDDDARERHIADMHARLGRDVAEQRLAEFRAALKAGPVREGAPS